jgi:hypothetical protein
MRSAHIAIAARHLLESTRLMRCLTRTAAVVLSLAGVACAVDRNGDGADLLASGGNANVGVTGAQGGSAGASNNATDMAGMAGSATAPGVGGNAGVFGVSNGSGSGGTEPGASDEGGTTTGTGTIDPVDSGTGTRESNDSAPAHEASSISSCALHQGGKTFTPDGAQSAHCYWPSPSTSTWQEALDACASEGGHLVTIGSSGEDDFVVKLFPNLTTNDRIWVGGTDKKTDTDTSGGGPYGWITGEPFDYAPWAPANPDGNCTATCGGRKCECQHRVCIDHDGAFWDRWDGDPNYSVCESEP